MSSHPELHGLRIGCVGYLNARPLIHAYEGEVMFDHPSRLAAALANGELDLALVPTFELFAKAGYKAVDGVSISSAGPVFSVFLAYRGRLGELTEIATDPSSLTSSMLLRCILPEHHGLNPRWVSGEAGEARLLIGNQAIAFRQQHGRDFQFLDLGEEWTARTGLPFVFALWVMRPGLEQSAPVARAMRRLKEEGMARLDEIVAAQSDFEPDFCRKYLGGHIRYELGDPEKRGVDLFRNLLVRHGLLKPGGSRLEFV